MQDDYPNLPRSEGVVLSYKILVVDSFERFRRFVCSLLQQRAEFQVEQAADGLQAVQRAEELQPDLILLDIGLPKLRWDRGCQTCSQAGSLCKNLIRQPRGFL